MIDPSRPIVFLDFDGCVTSIEDGTSFLCYNPEAYRYSEKCVKLLEDFCVDNNAQIVIASNWRKIPRDSYFTYDSKCYFNPLDSLCERLEHLIVDELPAIRHARKSVALVEYFNAHPELKDTKYCIVEDDERELYADYAEFSKRLVMCDKQTGLTADDVEKMIKTLRL